MLISTAKPRSRIMDRSSSRVSSGVGPTWSSPNAGSRPAVRRERLCARATTGPYGSRWIRRHQNAPLPVAETIPPAPLPQHAREGRPRGIFPTMLGSFSSHHLQAHRRPNRNSLNRFTRLEIWSRVKLSSAGPRRSLDADLALKSIHSASPPSAWHGSKSSICQSSI